MSKAAVLWLWLGVGPVNTTPCGKFKRAPQGLGRKDKTGRAGAAMIGLDAAVAIRNGCEDRERRAVSRKGKERGARPMQDIVELERRLTAAIGRIGAGVDRLSAVEPVVQDSASRDEDAAEIARLNEALDEERMANAQLNERLRVLSAREEASGGQAAAENDALKAQLAAQGDEIATLRRVLAEAGKEIAALRAARAEEAGEMAEIAAALEPLVAGAEVLAPTQTETGGHNA